MLLNLWWAKPVRYYSVHKISSLQFQRCHYLYKSHFHCLLTREKSILIFCSRYLQKFSQRFTFIVESVWTSTSVFRDGRISAHADPTSTRRANLIGTRLRYVFPPWTLLPGGCPIRPIFGFWEQSSPKWEIPCPGRHWTTVQNLTRLALCSPEKSVTVQTPKKQQTVNESTPWLSACVDNKLWVSKGVNVR